MACCYGNIYKIKLLPQKIKKPVTTDDSTRDYDTLVKSLNFRKLEITPDLQKIGNSEHHSHARLKLLIYGYSYGIHRTLKLERLSITTSPLFGIPLA